MLTIRQIIFIMPHRVILNGYIHTTIGYFIQGFSSAGPRIRYHIDAFSNF